MKNHIKKIEHNKTKKIEKKLYNEAYNKISNYYGNVDNLMLSNISPYIEGVDETRFNILEEFPYIESIDEVPNKLSFTFLPPFDVKIMESANEKKIITKKPTILYMKNKKVTGGALKKGQVYIFNSETNDYEKTPLGKKRITSINSEKYSQLIARGYTLNNNMIISPKKQQITPKEKKKYIPTGKPRGRPRKNIIPVPPPLPPWREYKSGIDKTISKRKKTPDEILNISHKTIETNDGVKIKKIGNSYWIKDINEHSPHTIHNLLKNLGIINTNVRLNYNKEYVHKFDKNIESNLYNIKGLMSIISNNIEPYYDLYSNQYTIFTPDNYMSMIPNYPGVYHGNTNCAISIYKKYIPKGKNSQSMIKFINNLDVKSGFTIDHAKTINDKYGFGCLMYDVTNKHIFDIKAKLNKKTIKMQAVGQHVYEYRNEDLPWQYKPERIEEPPNNDLYELAENMVLNFNYNCIPLLVFKRDFKTGDCKLVSIKTFNIEYKHKELQLPDKNGVITHDFFPLGNTSPIDMLFNNLRYKYPHNFISRDEQESNYLRLADYHMNPYWNTKYKLNKNIQCYEIDFNQAFIASASLKLTDKTNFCLPHWPTYWMNADNQEESLNLITKYSGFAHLTDFNFDKCDESIRIYLIANCMNRQVFTSPEIVYFVDNSITFTILSIQFNIRRQIIDWGFVDHYIKPGYNKNINRFLIGRIISNNDKHNNTICVPNGPCYEYYAAMLSDCILDVKRMEKVTYITYSFQSENFHNQQYHIHSYILSYLRIAMWELLRNIPQDDIIKINIDGIYVSTNSTVINTNLTTIGNFKIDNNSMGELGTIKLKKSTVKGEPYEKYTVLEPLSIIMTENVTDFVYDRIILEGAAGSGKTEWCNNLKSNRSACAFSNKLSNTLLKRLNENLIITNIPVKTAHTMYGIEYNDHKYKVTKIPKQHNHILDDVSLFPMKMLKNIVKKLMQYGKRITITFGDCQATLTKTQIYDYIKTLKTLHLFQDIYLEGSKRMDLSLFELSEKFRKDDRRQQILKLDKDIEYFDLQIKNLQTELKEYELTNEEKKSRNKDIRDTIFILKSLRKQKKDTLLEYISDYLSDFKIISSVDMIYKYFDDIENSTILTSTNKRKNLINNEILIRNPSIHKYVYIDNIRRYKNIYNKYDYVRNRGEIITINKDLIENDIELVKDLTPIEYETNIIDPDTKEHYKDFKTKCEHRHLFTVHSYQGDTINNNIYIDLNNFWCDNIFYSAITRSTCKKNIIFFDKLQETVDTKLCEEIEFKDFTHNSMSNFKIMNNIRTNLGGLENGNRCFYVNNQDIYRDLIKNLMITQGENFTINEMPYKTVDPIRLFIDIDIAIPEKHIPDIQKLIDSYFTGNDNKILQSTTGKLHIILGVSNNCFRDLIEKNRNNTTLTPIIEDFFKKYDLKSNHNNVNEILRKSLLINMRNLIFQIVKRDILQYEWNDKFDINAKGLRSAHSVKIQRGICTSRGTYTLFGKESILMEDKINDILDCSIYKKPVGKLNINKDQIRDLLNLQLNIYTLKTQKDNEEMKMQCNYNKDNNTINTNYGSMELTTKNINKIIDRLPKSFVDGKIWNFILLCLIRVKKEIPSFDHNYFLHEWSKNNSKKYNEENNNIIWNTAYIKSTSTKLIKQDEWYNQYYDKPEEYNYEFGNDFIKSINSLLKYSRYLSYDQTNPLIKNINNELILLNNTPIYKIDDSEIINDIYTYDKFEEFEIDSVIDDLKNLQPLDIKYLNSLNSDNINTLTKLDQDLINEYYRRMDIRINYITSH